LANVIDDWKMGITHVMRGEEWLSNTNKHVYLYLLLGANVPKFVHLPLIKAMNGKKLAKRDPSSAVKFFQSGKYEVEAIKCFLAQMCLNRPSRQP
jgi:glutamyl/glutaminyl-tRNA synthetase